MTGRSANDRILYNDIMKHTQAKPKQASSSTLRRRKLSQSDSNVREYAAVLAHAVETFGSRTKANVWLNRPSRVFDYQSPLQILTLDPAAVEEELVRIDHGIFY